MDIDKARMHITYLEELIATTTLRTRYNLQELRYFCNSVEDYCKRSISWSIFDFIQRAKEREGKKKWKKVYSRYKFQETLELMIQKHDCTIGITWDTIDFYLDEYCKIKEEE